MTPYIFTGKVLPERAQISTNFELSFIHETSGIEAKAKGSIILNQILITIYSKIHGIYTVYATLLIQYYKTIFLWLDI